MNIKKINLNLLVAFDALISEKNVTEAGKKLYITQSAMSSALAQLRELFNDPILSREGKAMKPTAKALRLAPKIREILLEIEQAIIPIEFDPKTTEYTFRIGMSDYVEYIVLPKLLPLLDKKAPNVRLKIFHLNALDKKESFDEMQLDMGIGVIFDKTPSSFNTELLFTDTSACVADANNPFIQTKLTLKKYLQAKHLVIIFPEEPYRNYIDNTLDQLGHKRNAVISVPHMIPGLFALANTPYLVTTTMMIAHSIKPASKFIIQNPPFKTQIIEVKQAWPKQFEHQASHQWLRSLIREATSGLVDKYTLRT